MRIAVLLFVSLSLFAGEARLVRSERACSNCNSIAADVNGDGLDDLVDFLTLRLNLGGTFADAVRMTGFKPDDAVVVWGDFNGDGFADVIVHAVLSFSMPGDLAFGPDRLLLGNGNGAFFAAPYAFADLGDVMKAADIDGDGKLDLVLVSDRATHVLHNEGAGSFTLQRTIDERPVDLAFGDFDSDGAYDIVTAQRDFLHFLLSSGATRNAFIGVEPRAIQTADVNGDGRLDVVLDDRSSRSFGLTALLGDGAGRFPKVTRVLVGESELGSVTGDLFIGGGAEVAHAQADAVIVYSASGDKLHEVARFTPDNAAAYAVVRGNFADGARSELLASVRTRMRKSEQYVLAPEGVVASRRRAVGGVTERDPIAGSWLIDVESDCALPALGTWTFSREGMFVTLDGFDAMAAYVPGDEMLVVRMSAGHRELHGELFLGNGALRGTLLEDVTPCTMRQGSHRITAARLF